MLNKRIYFKALIITVIYFILHLILIKDYSLSWDYHYHHYAGLYHLGLTVPSMKDPSPVPFSSPDSRLTIEDPFGPFTQIIPTLFQVILHDRLNLLPFDIAYNLPIVISGALGVGLLFIFISKSIGLKQAYIATFFLSFLPNYFAYLHNNMKDIPNAVAFAFSIFTFWLLVHNKNIKMLIFAVFSFAFAFNIKINSIMIPVVCLIWVLLYQGKEYASLLFLGWKKIYKSRILFIVVYFFLAPIMAVVIWWPFWNNPISKLLELPYFYSHNTINMPVLLFGHIYYSGVNIPIFYPYIFILINTQVPILISFIIGIYVSLRRIKEKKGIYLLIIIWFIVPLLRYFNPKSGAIDGMRHFMEIIYPLCFIAGIGASEILNILLLNKKFKIINYSIIIIFIIIIIYPIYYYHPYQTSYFNIITNGIKGAEGKFDIDYWGTPQKEAVYWLNKNAPIGSAVYIAMAQSTAATYLRADLLSKLNTTSINNSDYIMVLNRQSMYETGNLSSLISKKIRENKTVYQKIIDGVSLVWVFSK